LLLLIRLNVEPRTLALIPLFARTFIESQSRWVCLLVEMKCNSFLSLVHLLMRTPHECSCPVVLLYSCAHVPNSSFFLLPRSRFMFHVLLEVVRARAIRLFVDVSNIGSTVFAAERLIPCPFALFSILSLHLQCPLQPPSGSTSILHPTPCFKFQVVLDPLLARRVPQVSISISYLPTSPSLHRSSTSAARPLTV
jgi:hypothetical protein